MVSLHCEEEMRWKKKDILPSLLKRQQTQSAINGRQLPPASLPLNCRTCHVLFQASRCQLSSQFCRIRQHGNTECCPLLIYDWNTQCCLLLIFYWDMAAQILTGVSRIQYHFRGDRQLERSTHSDKIQREQWPKHS